MLGAIIGDIVGSVYEFSNIKKKNLNCLNQIVDLRMIQL